MPDPEGERARLAVDPEPTADARTALEQALAETRNPSPVGARTAWWRSGVGENLGHAAGDDPR